MTTPVSPTAVMLIVPGVFTCAGLVACAVCRPLIHGKVGPNPLYGIRTPSAFRSEENWYRINRLGGKILFQWGAFVALVGLAGLPVYFAGTSGMLIYNVVAAMLVVGSLAVAVVRILRIS